MAEAEITFSYGEGEDIFHSFSFSAAEGEHVLLLAPPGSGKTTLARIITGSVPAYSGGSLSGFVSVCGRDILSLPVPERMEYAGRVSQNSDEMMLFSCVEEEILFPLANLGLAEDEIERRLSSVLALLGLEKYRKVPSSELSGGEKRRLMLAILFAVDPALYILDESFDELSPSWRRKLAGMIHTSPRSILVLGSHELGEYSGVFDRVISIEDGKAGEYRRTELKRLEYRKSLESEHVLDVSSLSIERRHRSTGGSGFTLSVPSFSLRSGECAVLMGENGSGKSSFSRVLSGLLEEKSGSVMLDGRVLSPRERRRSAAVLMQNPYEELFLPTVGDELESTGAAASLIEAALSMFSLEREWYTAEISYGRAKLLQAALFYLLRRPFAVFDEFDSSLPYEESQAAVRAFLESGSGVIVITHDEAFAASLPGKRWEITEGVLHEC